jgi:hypothetical protein
METPAPAKITSRDSWTAVNTREKSLTLPVIGHAGCRNYIGSDILAQLFREHTVRVKG